MLIAYRELKIRTPSGETWVPIRLFQPEEEGGMWVCRYEIGWPDKTFARFGAGADSMQALVHAIMDIGTELYRSDHHQSGTLTWDDRYEGYGFPLISTMREQLVGNDKTFF